MTTDELVRRMVGRELTQLFPKQDAEIGEPVLEVDAAHARGRLHRRLVRGPRAARSSRSPASSGAGRSEVARAIFGVDTPRRGRVTVDGVELKPGSPTAAMAGRASGSCPRTAASRAS